MEVDCVAKVLSYDLRNIYICLLVKLSFQTYMGTDVYYVGRGMGISRWHTPFLLKCP